MSGLDYSKLVLGMQQNMYTILNEEESNNTKDKDTVVTQMAVAATTGSTIGNTYAATNTTTIPAKVTVAFNQLLVHQLTIMKLMAAMSFIPPPSIAAPAFNVPPSKM